MGDGRRIAIVGSGPAGLMAAFVAARDGAQVTLFEKRRAPGRKLLIAGSSGLNIGYACPPAELAGWYRGPSEMFARLFRVFSREDWLAFVQALGLETFEGTSRRYFVREMKASGLLRAWTERLKAMGVTFEFGREAVDFSVAHGPRLHLRHVETDEIETRAFDAIGFFLGGGSWEPDEVPLRWPEFFRRAGVAFVPFRAANCGYGVAWPAPFLKEAEGLPLKNVELRTAAGARKGELVVTAYGLEGTPIYAIGAPGPARLDLKPDLGEREILAKLTTAPKENLSPMRRVGKYLRLCDASAALLFHGLPAERRADLRALVASLKDFPIVLGEPRPLAEAISSAGGVDLREVDESFMLRRFPGVYLGGEMLDWDAPTGGFLIQACVAQGYAVGQAMVRER